MIGIIILISLLICALCLLIALLYIRQTEIEVKDKSVDLESVLPIQTITENAVINGNGDITVGYRLLLPEVFTLSESEAQYIHERLEALLKLLPAGTVIHQQNFYYTGRYHHAEYSSNALIAENNRHFNGKEILNSYTNLYVTFTNGSRNGKIRKSASGTSLMRKLHYPFKQPYKEYQQRLTEMEAFLMNFENGLSSIQQFEIRKMDDTELNNAIYDYVNLSYETPENDATQKSVNPMAVSESGSMKIGQQHVSILSLTNEGEHLQELAVPHTGKSKAYGGNIEIPDSIRSKCSMLYPVGLGLPFNHIVPLHSQSANGVVVQLVRIPACHAGGRGFESRPYRKISKQMIAKPCKVYLQGFFLFLYPKKGSKCSPKSANNQRKSPPPILCSKHSATAL